MVRRRSMALSAAGLPIDNGGLVVNEGRASSLGYNSDIKNASARWSDVPEYRPEVLRNKELQMGDEERLDMELERARRNSRDQEVMIRRAR
jgi:hypothetical protein